MSWFCGSRAKEEHRDSERRKQRIKLEQIGYSSREIETILAGGQVEPLHILMEKLPRPPPKPAPLSGPFPHEAAQQKAKHAVIFDVLIDLLVADTIGIVVRYACEPYIYLGRKEKRSGWNQELYSLLRPKETVQVVPTAGPFLDLHNIYLKTQVFAARFGMDPKNYFLHFAAGNVPRKKSVFSADQKLVYTLDLNRRSFYVEKVIVPGKRAKEKKEDEEARGEESEAEKERKLENDQKEDENKEELPLNTRILSSTTEIVYHNQRVYFFSVEEDLARIAGTQTVWVYNCASRHWQRNSIPGPLPQSFFSLAKGEGNDAYLTGGLKDERTGQASHCCYKINLESLTWKGISGMPVPRAGHFSFFCEGKLYICGGATNPREQRLVASHRKHQTGCDSVIEYNPGHNEWRTLPIICPEPLFAMVVYQ